MNHIVELDDYDCYAPGKGYFDMVLREDVVEWLNFNGLHYKQDGCRLLFESPAGPVSFRLRWPKIKGL